VIKRFSTKETRQIIVFLIVVTTLSLSIIYTNVRTFDTSQIYSTGYQDSLIYLDMYFGKYSPVLGVRRPLVPFVARLVPDLPGALFPLSRTIDPLAMVAFKFAVVNFFFLVATCLALYFLHRGFGMNYFTAFIGTMLFLGSSTVVRSAGLPLTDAAFFFFLTLNTIAIQQDNLLLLFFAQSVGVLAKELVVLISLPLILLSLLTWQRKRWMLLATLPAILIHIIIRSHMPALPVRRHDFVFLLEVVSGQLSVLATPRGLIKLFFSFSLACIPAIYALVKCKVPLLLRHWSWAIPIVFLGVLILKGNFDRTMFSIFPVVIPLAALGLSSWLDSESLSIK